MPGLPPRLSPDARPGGSFAALRSRVVANLDCTFSFEHNFGFIQTVIRDPGNMAVGGTLRTRSG